MSDVLNPMNLRWNFPSGSSEMNGLIIRRIPSSQMRTNDVKFNGVCIYHLQKSNKISKFDVINLLLKVDQTHFQERI